MSVPSLHVLHGLVSTSPSFFLSQIHSSRLSTEIEQSIAAAAGVPFPQFVANTGQRPNITFETSQLATLLGQTGLSGVDLTAGTTSLYLKKAKQLARREANASTVHTRFLAEQCGLFWTTITARNRGRATASCVLKIPYDGSNEPIVPAGSVALAGTSTASEWFVAGPVKLNGVQFQGVQEITIDSGLRFIEAGSDSDLYDTFVAVEQVAPTITIRTLDATVLSTMGLNGAAVGGSGFVVYLKAATSGANYASAGSSAHIKFSGTVGQYKVNEIAAGDNSPAMTEWVITPVGADASTDPITVATGQTIS